MTQTGAPSEAESAGSSGRPRPIAIARVVVGFVGLILLALAVFLPGQHSLPPLDRDEPRFTQATKQMVESGNYVDIRFQDVPRYKKPIGIYWLQAVAVKATGFGADAPIWVYRIPSLLGALAGVLLVFWTARAFLPAEPALLAAGVAALTILLGVEAHLGKTDAVLFGTIMAAQGALAYIWRAARRGEPVGLALPLIFWLALALGVLVKGPIGPMVAGLTALALALSERRFAWLKALRPVSGLILLVVVVAPWFVAIALASKGAFFTEAVGKDMLGKVGQGQEAHWAPPLTYLVVSLATFWPLPPFTVAAAPAIWRLRRTEAIRFAFAWAVPSWIVFEVVSTKLPHYVLPLMPAVALATVAALTTERSGASLALRIAAAILMALVPVVLALAAIILPFSLGDYPNPLGAVLVIAGAIVGVFAAIRLGRRRIDDLRKAVPLAGLSAVFVLIGLWAFVLPNLRPVWISPRLVEAARSVAGCPDPTIASVGFNEPSLVFLAGTGTKLVDPAAGVDALKGGGCVVAAVDRRFEQVFKEEAAEEHVPVELKGREGGININGGRKLDLGLYVKAAQ